MTVDPTSSGSDWNMVDLIEAFPEQLREAARMRAPASFGPSFSAQQLLVAGMGGSGVAAPLLESLAPFRLPMFLLQDYALPEWAGPSTLVVASSHSGNTAETVSVAQQAIDRGCRVVVLSSGGRLAEMAQTHGLDRLVLPEGRPPRSCLGYSLVLLAQLLHHHGVLERFPEAEVLRAAEHLETHQEDLRREAKNLAQRLHVASASGTTAPMPYLLSTQPWMPVLRRWCQQLQENANLHAFAERFPEMNHNALVAWTKASPALLPIVFESSLDDQRNAQRRDWTRERLQHNGQEVLRLKALGQDAWEQAFAWVHLGDWLSVELALLRGEDAMDIGIIDALKAHLSPKVGS